MKFEFDGLAISEAEKVNKKGEPVNYIKFLDQTSGNIFTVGAKNGLKVDPKFIMTPCHFILDGSIVEQGIARWITIDNILGKLNGKGGEKE